MRNRLCLLVGLLLPVLAISLALRAEENDQAPEPTPADEMLDRMLRDGEPEPERPLPPLDDPPEIDATTGDNAVAPDAPEITVMREGTFLVDRVGRLTPGADGQQMEFVFESDGRALRDPPVVILPNLRLMSMENAVRNSGRDLRFRITGMVTEYRGRNYVLLEKAVVVPD